MEGFLPPAVHLQLTQDYGRFSPKLPATRFKKNVSCRISRPKIGFEELKNFLGSAHHIELQK